MGNVAGIVPIGEIKAAHHFGLQWEPAMAEVHLVDQHVIRVAAQSPLDRSPQHLRVRRPALFPMPFRQAFLRQEGWR